MQDLCCWLDGFEVACRCFVWKVSATYPAKAGQSGISRSHLSLIVGEPHPRANVETGKREACVPRWKGAHLLPQLALAR